MMGPMTRNAKCLTALGLLLLFTYSLGDWIKLILWCRVEAILRQIPLPGGQGSTLTLDPPIPPRVS